MKTKAKALTLTPEVLDLPGTHYHADSRLVTWHPEGIFDDELADQVVEFIETGERILGKPFNRFTDLTGLDRINISLNHVFDIARRRKKGNRGLPVKSAFYALRLISITIARMYQELMEESPIEIGVFRDRAAAAEWLGVSVETLQAPAAIKT